MGCRADVLFACFSSITEPIPFLYCLGLRVAIFPSQCRAPSCFPIHMSRRKSRVVNLSSPRTHVDGPIWFWETSFYLSARRKLTEVGHFIIIFPSFYDDGGAGATAADERILLLRLYAIGYLMSCLTLPRSNSFQIKWLKGRGMGSSFEEWISI